MIQSNPVVPSGLKKVLGRLRAEIEFGTLSPLYDVDTIHAVIFFADLSTLFGGGRGGI